MFRFIVTQELALVRARDRHVIMKQVIIGDDAHEEIWDPLKEVRYIYHACA